MWICKYVLYILSVLVPMVYSTAFAVSSGVKKNCITVLQWFPFLKVAFMSLRVTHWSVWSCVCTAPPPRLASCLIWWKAFQRQTGGCCGTSQNLSSCPQAPSPPDMESHVLLVYMQTLSPGLWGWSAGRTSWWIDKAHWYESGVRHQQGLTLPESWIIFTFSCPNFSE